MNLKKKRILALLGVGLISALTSAPTLKDANAALTAPASYDINYRWDSVNDDTFKLGSTSIGTYAPFYTRTSDGIYYNYSTTIDISDSSLLPLGLEITMTFNRSNTAWFVSSSNYFPDQNKIGSDTTVGSVSNKIYLKFNNQTSKDYLLNLDISSTTSGVGGANYEFQDNTNVLIYFPRTEGFQNFYLPSYTNLEFYFSSSSTARYFDAWYLQDLGVSAAYDAGLDDGYIQGQDDADLLVTGFSAMVGILVNFVLMIANLEVLGVSLMGILTIIILFAGIVWTLKLIRG